MEITKNSWNDYISKLRRIDERAAAEMKAYVTSHGVSDSASLIRYAKAISDRYGNAAASLACKMYDSVAEASGVLVAPAEPAEVATYAEVAKTVNGTKQNDNLLSNAVSRLCKMTAADTILNNAERDGAQFAWIPSGDSCAFCFTLSSRGWQYISKESRKNGHAEHIHANCDCTYAIRFSNKNNVEGYNPDAMREEYHAEGGTNGIRRKLYSRNKDKINAQKRVNYARMSISKLPEYRFSVYHPSSSIVNDEYTARLAIRNSSPKVKEILKDIDIKLGCPGSKCDYRNGIIYLGVGCTEDEVHHEIGHLIEKRLMDKNVVEEYKRYLLEGLSSSNIQEDYYTNNVGESVKVFLVKGPKFESEYQGRIYPDKSNTVTNEQDNIETYKMLEVISEPYRKYKNGEPVSDIVKAMIEEAIL